MSNFKFVFKLYSKKHNIVIFYTLQNQTDSRIYLEASMLHWLPFYDFGLEIVNRVKVVILRPYPLN